LSYKEKFGVIRKRGFIGFADFLTYFVTSEGLRKAQEYLKNLQSLFTLL
jgi:hypothetical protein